MGANDTVEVYVSDSIEKSEEEFVVLELEDELETLELDCEWG